MYPKCTAHGAFGVFPNAWTSHRLIHGICWVNLFMFKGISMQMILWIRLKNLHLLLIGKCSKQSSCSEFDACSRVLDASKFSERMLNLFHFTRKSKCAFISFYLQLVTHTYLACFVQILTMIRFFSEIYDDRSIRETQNWDENFSTKVKWIWVIGQNTLNTALKALKDTLNYTVLHYFHFIFHLFRIRSQMWRNKFFNITHC